MIISYTGLAGKYVTKNVKLSTTLLLNLYIVTKQRKLQKVCPMVMNNKSPGSEQACRKLIQFGYHKFKHSRSIWLLFLASVFLVTN